MVHGRYAAATPLRPPASRFAHPERFAWEALRLREAAAALRSASSYFGEGAAGAPSATLRCCGAAARLQRLCL
jgi:hypothetical protein